MHLIITEKNNTAKRIAQILSKGSVEQKKIDGVNIYEYDDSTIVGLSGHIVTIDFPDRYNNWSEVEPHELIEAEIISIPVQKKIVNVLKKLAKKADRITIATDYDREGELIGVEALRLTLSTVPVDRVRYSAITPSEIANAFLNPSNIDLNLASAGEARQKIDLVWGAALTRFISLSSRRLGKNFLSVGRVQSPLLALLVNREKEIEAFKTTPYWEIHALCRNGGEFTAKHEKGRFLEKGEAESIISRLGREGIISKLEQEEQIENPPIPFNTTEFLRASSAIGLSPANAMRIAEGLYIDGWISYPRTDNTVYPKSLDTREIIRSLSKHDEFKEHADALLKKDVLKPTRGKKETTDHPPIYPVTAAKKSALGVDEWKIYELVVRRFFATFADPAIWENTKVSVDIGGETFKADGLRLLDAGWRWHYPYNTPKETILPSLRNDEQLDIVKVDLIERETKPPKRYGQGTLIKKMEDLGLGTKSTRHEMLSKLYARGYVYGNPVRPTKTAMVVVDTLERYAEIITQPDMSRTLEEDMDGIAEGRISEEAVVQESKDMLNSVFGVLNERREHISDSLRKGLREENIIGACPECSSDLTVRRSKRGGRFIGCTGYPDCTFTLPLPKSGRLIVTQNSCEIHGLHMVKIISKGRRAWDLGCPYCNYIEWQKSKKE
ncbi:MAG: DNA topoisomerase I [Methanosarcinales archaeon Met12]|nr:MAG: DNA topoisomerase I [Methanosarcinales archaeon Met12]